jgi:hypothetical protein
MGLTTRFPRTKSNYYKISHTFSTRAAEIPNTIPHRMEYFPHEFYTAWNMKKS